MLSVGTAVLKNELSVYLHKVRKGVKVLITDRGRPIAKLVPLDSHENEMEVEEKLALLEKQGILTRPKKQGHFSKWNKISLKGKKLASEMILEDRDERDKSLLSGFKRAD